jgi:hypothetical protein
MKRIDGRAAFKKILLLLFATLLPLLVTELILRLAAPVYPIGTLRAYEYDPEMGFRPRPAQHYYKMTDHQEELKVNQHGAINFQENFEGYKTLVFAVGDSYTQGTGVPADMSYPFQLDLILNQDERGFYRKQFGVVNLGLGAIGGEQKLIRLRHGIASYGPPAVILYLGCDNDQEEDVLFKSGYMHRHMVAGSPRWKWAVGPLQWLTEDFQVGLRAKMALATLRRQRALQAAQQQPVQPGGPASIPARSPSVAELQAPVLEKLIAHSKESGAVLVVSWVGTRESYDWLRGWAGAKGIAFADWWPKVDSVLAAVPALPLENDHSGGHYRGWVNRLMAEEFARQIRRPDRPLTIVP